MSKSLPVDMEASGRCPACQVITPAVRAFSVGETDFIVCQSCGLFFREKLPSVGELEAIYAAHYEEGNISSGHTEQESGDFALEGYARFLGRLFGPAMKRVLDYGAGTGRLVALMRDAGLDAAGLEFSIGARQNCLRVRGFSLLATREQLVENDYDVVTMVEVIEHLPELIGDLEAIRGSLRHGGVVFVTTPNRSGLRARFQKGYWTEARKKFHLFLFDSATLKKTLLKAGFAEVDVVRFSPIQKRGFHYWLYGRLCQCFGVPGTLCVIARK